MKNNVFGDLKPYVSAPGKLVLAGEYAVLEGSTTVVCATETRAILSLLPGSEVGSHSSVHSSRLSLDKTEKKTRLPDEALVALERVQHGESLRFPMGVEIDVHNLRQAGQKLGLGSSSAATVVVVAAVLAYAGKDIHHESVRDKIFRYAFDAHSTISPRGSGIDVASCTYGGFLSFRRDGGQVSLKPLPAPVNLHMRVVWSGIQVRTNVFLDNIYAWREREPAVYADLYERMGHVATLFESGFSAGDASAVVTAAERYASLMEELGTMTGLPIVEERLRAIGEIARQCGGAAKPSGAGGGDVAVAFFSSSNDAEHFEREIASAHLAARYPGLGILNVPLGADGVRNEQNDMETVLREPESA